MPRLTRTILATAVALAIACHGKSPTSPSSYGDPIIRGAIDGPASIAPGSTAQLHFIKTFANGTTEDDTSKAAWNSSDSAIVAISSSGLATGVSRGVANVTASYGATAGRPFFVLEDGTFVLAGTVTEDTLPVLGAQVAVTRGTGKGLAAVTDWQGRYTLYGVAGDIDVQASRDGYVPATRSVSVISVAQSLDFALQETQAPFDFVGDWHATFTPSSTCTALADDVGSRTFDVSVSQLDAKAKLRFTASTLPKPPTVVGHATHQALDFHLQSYDDDWYYYYRKSEPDLVELLEGDRILVISGDVHLSVTTRATATGTLKGYFTTFVGPGYRYPESACQATDHAVTLQR